MSAQVQSLPAALPTTKKTHGFSVWFWVAVAFLAIAGLASPNPWLTFSALLLLPIFVRLLWRRGEPPALVFACCMQWLQASAAIFYTDYYGMSLDQAFGSNELEFASWLSLLAVLVLAVGIRLAIIRTGPSPLSRLETEAYATSIPKLAAFYAASFVLSACLNAVAFGFSSITQILLAFAAIKWVFVFLLCYSILQQREGYGYLVFVVCLEFSTGLLGIFANFKSVFFVLIVAAMSSALALRGRRMAVTVLCGTVLFISGVVWSAIKTDYRAFLNEEGVTPGAEAISVERKFGKLADVMSSLTWGNFTEGIDALVLRVSYVNYFALAIQNVPSHVPFENGALWVGSLKHIMMPRLFFPNKPELDDSERTRLYTGMQVAGQEAGTSIGIGYVGESYIDYGPVGMFFPIFLLGIFYGLIYRFFVIRVNYKLFGSAIATAILVFGAYTIETSNIKLVGGNVTVLLVLGSIYVAAGRTLTNAWRR